IDSLAGMGWVMLPQEFAETRHQFFDAPVPFRHPLVARCPVYVELLLQSCGLLFYFERPLPQRELPGLQFLHFALPELDCGLHRHLIVEVVECHWYSSRSSMVIYTA